MQSCGNGGFVGRCAEAYKGVRVSMISASRRKNGFWKILLGLTTARIINFESFPYAPSIALSLDSTPMESIRRSRESIISTFACFLQAVRRGGHICLGSQELSDYFTSTRVFPIIHDRSRPGFESTFSRLWNGMRHRESKVASERW